MDSRKVIHRSTFGVDRARSASDAFTVGNFDTPFVGSRAIEDGELTDHQLRHDYTRIYRDIYIGNRTPITAVIKAWAAALYGGADAVLTGFSAAAIHGSRWIGPDESAEVVRGGHLRSPKNLIIRDYRLEPDEITVVDGIRLTTPARAAFDLGRRLPEIRAVVALDALSNATGLKPHEVSMLAERHRGMRGVVALRAILDNVDGGAESPPETHTRLLLVGAGLPRPETQLCVSDESGQIVARADLGWRRWSVLVEYDGEHHWTDRRQRAWDIERSVILEALGWTVVRVGAELLYDRPQELIRRVRAKLRAAGAPL